MVVKANELAMGGGGGASALETNVCVREKLAVVMPNEHACS